MDHSHFFGFFTIVQDSMYENSLTMVMVGFTGSHIGSIT